MRQIYITVLVIVINTVFISLCAISTAQERSARENLRKGESLYQAQDYKQAIEQFRAALDIFQSDKADSKKYVKELKQILERLYFSNRKLNNYQETIEYGTAYLNLDPENEAIVRDIAQIYTFRQQNINNALKIWKDYDKKYNSIVAKQEIAELYSRLNNIPEAVKWFNAALEINNDVGVLHKMANMYINHRDTHRAFALFEDFLASNPPDKDKGRAYRSMGIFFQDLKNNHKALENYELALRYDYDRSITLWLVTQYFDSNQFNYALRHIANMQQRNPNDPEAAYFKGLILYRQADYTQAFDEFKKVENDAEYGRVAKEHIDRITKRKY